MQTKARLLEIEFVELKLLDTTKKPLNSHIPMIKFTTGNKDPASMQWNRTMHILIPLAISGRTFGAMAVSKDIVSFPLTPFTLRRIEQLRRTILGTLIKIENNHPGEGHGCGQQ